MHMTDRTDYLGRDVLAAMPRAMTKGTIRSAKSPGIAGNQENSTVSPNPANMAVSVPWADIDRPSRRKISRSPCDLINKCFALCIKLRAEVFICRSR